LKHINYTYTDRIRYPILTFTTAKPFQKGRGKMTFDNGGVMFRNDRSVGRSVRHPLTDRSVGPFGPTYVDLRTMCGTWYRHRPEYSIPWLHNTYANGKWRRAQPAAHVPVLPSLKRYQESIAALLQLSLTLIRFFLLVAGPFKAAQGSQPIFTL